MRVEDLEAIRIKLASPEDILLWSHGEVLKPETINYRTQRAEKDGLFCEKIFGPEKDYECYCGKYRRIRYKGVICDKCGVEVTKSVVRRERMGHIKLAVPCSHIWFLRGVPSRIGMVLDIPMGQLERVIYFASYIITKVDDAAKQRILDEIDKEYKIKAKNPRLAVPSVVGKQGKAVKPGKIKNKSKELTQELEELKKSRDKAKEEVSGLKPLKVLSEVEYHNLSLKYGSAFEAGTGAETLRNLFSGVNLKKLVLELSKAIEGASPAVQKNILKRLRLIKGLLRAGVRPEWMFLTAIPILPPDLRPMVQLDGGRFASSDLNDLYRRVINRNNRLKYLLEIKAPEVIVRNEKRMLQEAVDALIDNGMRKGQTTTATTGGKRLLKSLSDILKGKQGRFRQNLLGKRVDYSGRSVIVVGPELKLDQCGIPKKMALELFKPFVIKKILDGELAYNVRGASRLIELKTPEIWAILEEVVKEKFVLLNRAPTLHRLGIQAFKPLLVEGEVLRIHPLVCKAFNADFDGDQMAVHIPLSKEAQKEAKEIMNSSFNLLKPATGTPIVGPTQDIVLGCYWTTKIKEEAFGAGKIFGSKNEAILARDTGVVDLRAWIKVRMADQPDFISSAADAGKRLKKLSKEPFSRLVETTVGRILFNNTLPEGYPFINEEMNSKKLDGLVSKIIEKYDTETVKTTLDKIKELGFEYSTLSGITWGIDDLVVPEEKKGLIKEAEKKIELIDNYYKKGLLTREEKRIKSIEIWQQVKIEIEKLVPKTLNRLGPVFSIISSGARGSWSQPVQMTGMKGLVINPAGQIIELPIKSSFKEGFNVLEYFISTHGARKGTADTALRTSTAGYLTRRLVDVAHEMVAMEEDCGDEDGLILYRKDAEEIGQNFIFKIVGRTALDNIQDPKSKSKIVKKGEIIDWEKAEAINEAGIEEVRAGSSLSCKCARGICRKCYGWDMGNNQLIKFGGAAGIVAAQAIGEPGTQLTMKTFHTGGVAGSDDITQGLPRVQEIFENRAPVGKAVISFVDGEVKEIGSDGLIKIKVSAEGESASGAKNQGSETRGAESMKSDGKKLKNKKRKKEDFAEYEISARKAIWVKEGDFVKKGQQLCEGSVDLKELFRAAGAGFTQKHVIKEVQRIYVSQGVTIHDKHLEVIARQMFSRVRIKEPGQSVFNVGEVVERARLIEENERLKKEEKEQAKAVQILLGISKVALTTDSFLSAASFQETSRVLIKAALEGKEDKLKGLKENVIIGKLIPAGTGFRNGQKT